MKFQMKINFPWSRPLLACCFVMFALTAMADLRTLKEYWNMKQSFGNIYQSLVSLFAVNLQPKQKQMYKNESDV